MKKKNEDRGSRRKGEKLRWQEGRRNRNYVRTGKSKKLHIGGQKWKNVARGRKKVKSSRKRWNEGEGGRKK